MPLSLKKSYIVYSVDDRGREKIHKVCDNPSDAYKNASVLKKTFKQQKVKFNVREVKSKDRFSASVHRAKETLAHLRD